MATVGGPTPNGLTTPFGGAEEPALSPEQQQATEITIAPEVRRRIASSRSFAPSVRQQTQSEIINMTLLHGQLGNPFSTRRIPFSVLRDMITDPMLAMGLFYIKTPLIRADWSVKSPDAQLAAAVDEAFRPVRPWQMRKALGKLAWGYQPMVRRFKLGQLKSVFRDPHSDNPDEDQPVWTSENVQPILWDVPYALAPENCIPRWSDRGEFDGFTYSTIPVPNPIQIGTGQLYGEQVMPGYNIPLEFSMWPVNEIEENFGCSPPDEPVLTTEGWVAIGDLDPNKHRLVSYDLREDKIYRGQAPNPNFAKGYEFEKNTRPYNGKLYTIEAGDKQTRVTPNHKLSVRWSKKVDDHWAVYLMRKGDWWRIGVSRLHRDKQHANSGVGCRMTVEQADDAWIVFVADNKRDALWQEALWSNQYNIPDITFRAANGVLTTEDLECLWCELDSETGARRLIEDQGLYADYPLYSRRIKEGKQRATQAGYKTKWTCFAANLLPGLMEVPIDPGAGSKVEWRNFSLDREDYVGDVVSLEVKPFKHYVSAGIITQNSIYGSPRIKRAYRYFWSYWYRWALADRSFEKKADPPVEVYYPTDETYGIDPNDPNPMDPSKVNVQGVAVSLGEQVRSGSVLAIPGDVIRDDQGKPSSVRKWSVGYVEGGENFDLLDRSFAHLDLLKIRSLFLPESIFIGGRSQSTGGQSVAKNVSTPIEVFEESQQLLADEEDDEVNRVLIPQFIAANFPEKLGTPCSITTRGFGQADTEIIKQLIQLVGQTKGYTLPVDTRELLRQANIPLLTQPQQEKLEEQIAKEAEKMQPPVQNPEKVGMQGYNSGITKTPLGNIYVQPPERIDLDYQGINILLQELPNIPAYKDKTTSAMLVRTKKIFEDRYRKQIKSFVEHLKDHTPLQLALAAQANGIKLTQIKAPEPPAEEAKPEEGSAPPGIMPAAASATATAIVGAWYATQPVDKVRELFAGIMDNIVTRSGQAELKNIALDSSVYDTAATKEWVDEYASTTMESVDATLRREMITFLTAELQKTLDPKQIINDAEVHFADTPETHAARVARASTRDGYNFGMLAAGKDAGITQVQAHDASDGDDPDTDPKCVERNGKVMTIDEALGETEHPNGTLHWRYLPTDNFSVSRVGEFPEHLAVPDDMHAAYDPQTETLYVDTGTTADQERGYALTLGAQLAGMASAQDIN